MSRAGVSSRATETSPHWQETGHRSIWMPYCQMQTAPLPTAVTSTEGVYLCLQDGRRVIDGLASWWSACHGYNHPHIIESMKSQLEVMPHVMFGGIQHEPALRLANRLSNLLPGNLQRVFFSDSGSVAVEVAMKMAIQSWYNRGCAKKNTFVSFHNAYHGDTTGAMSLCDPERSMHQVFSGSLLQQSCHRVPSSAGQQKGFASWLSKHRDEVAGVFIEPLVQGAGGMRFHEPDVLSFLRELCSDCDVLLITDELATGFCRTGSMFAVEQANVTPDITCLGKALTGGAIGMAATVATEELFEHFMSDDPAKALMHGPTYMANPLACSAANASLDLFQSEPRQQQARDIESVFREALECCRELPIVADVRAMGAIGAIEVHQLARVDQLRQMFLDNGVWLRPFGDVIYATPALTISKTELNSLCEVMVRVVHDWAKEN